MENKYFLIGIGGKANYIVAGTVVVLFIPIMVVIRMLGRKVTEKYRNRRVFISFEEDHEKELYEKFAANDVHIKKTFFHNKYQKDGIHYKEVIIYFTPSRDIGYEELVNKLVDEDWILSIEEA